MDFAGTDFRRSTELYRKSCDGGYADGCLFAAQAIEAPYANVEAPAPTELPKMILDAEVLGRQKLLDRACALGSAPGCKRLGDVFIGKNGDKARAAYQKACRSGADAEGCEKARTHEVDVGEGFRDRCTHGDADACASLGDLLWSVDPPRAVRLFASECALRGVAEVVGGIGAFISQREREAAKGIPLSPEERPRAAPQSNAPVVVARTVSVAGGVAMVSADRVLAQHAEDFASCVAALPKSPPTVVSAKLIVDLTGDVFRATLSGAVPENVGPCLTGALEELVFARPGAIASLDVSVTVGEPAATRDQGR
jgi:hypothetical protein